MEVRAIHKYVRISPQKCRLVMNQVRGMKIGEALELLDFSRHKAGGLVKKALNSAIANAENNHGADIDDLFISRATVDAGPTFKRYRARAKGRPGSILKPTSHITVAVSDRKAQAQGKHAG